ncbi:MAG: hypothetical protein ABSG56_29895 [Bryobacteraceae bacterium]|jgi:hypothetical protein
MEVSFDETGFELHRIGQTDETAKCFRWQEITVVLACKRDCFAFDLICLVIADAMTAVEINEQDDGWDAFIAAASKNLANSVPRDTWWAAVAQPPFAANQTIVYRKGQQFS